MSTVEACLVLGGLSPVFSAAELKTAYRKAAAENHPDKGGDAEQMRLVNAAFELLSSLSTVATPPPPLRESVSSSDARALPQIELGQHPLDKHLSSGVMHTLMCLRQGFNVQAAGGATRIEASPDVVRNEYETALQRARDEIQIGIDREIGSGYRR